MYNNQIVSKFSSVLISKILGLKSKIINFMTQNHVNKKKLSLRQKLEFI